MEKKRLESCHLELKKQRLEPRCSLAAKWAGINTCVEEETAKLECLHLEVNQVEVGIHAFD